MASAVATRRLRKELLNLQKDPPPGIIAEPLEHDILTWLFALRGPPNTPYHAGVYIGKLVFPVAYPMKAPRILMLTPSARFVVNERICMSMSDFHPELWNPSWSVATILTGVVSFMTSEEVTTGGIAATEEERKRLAMDSIEYNKKHFAHLFQGDFMAAFARADEARELAEKDRIATLVKKATKQKATPAVIVQPSQQEQGKQGANEQDGQKQQHNSNVEQSSKNEELILPEEAEKRRLKNAKKRAKQKAKKHQAAAGVDSSHDDDDAKKVEE
jgi:ubiquitin-conjugating enzyme E2 J2